MFALTLLAIHVLTITVIFTVTWRILGLGYYNNTIRFHC